MNSLVLHCEVYAQLLDPVREIQTHGDLLFTADVGRMVTIWKEGVDLHQWDFRSDNERLSALDIVRSISITEDGKSVFVAAGPEIHKYDIESGEQQLNLSKEPTMGFIITGPQQVVHTPFGFAASFDNGTVSLFDHENQLKVTIKDNEAPIHIQSDPSTGDIIGVAGFTLSRYRSTGQLVQRVAIADRAFALAWNPLVQLAAVRTAPSVEIINLATREIVAHIETAPGAPSLAASAARPEFAFADENGVYLLDASGKKQLVPTDHPHLVLCLAFSEDGNRLYAGLSDGKVIGWDLSAVESRGTAKVGSAIHGASIPMATSRSVFSDLRFGALIAFLAAWLPLAVLSYHTIYSRMVQPMIVQIMGSAWLGFCFALPFAFVGAGLVWLRMRFQFKI